MTLDEKISLVSGAKEPVYAGQAAYSAGLPKYGIPSMRWADGQGGINGAQDATTLPSLQAQAATFDTSLAQDLGSVLGGDARAMKMDVVLAPFVNLNRLTNSNGYGEDPFLAGEMAAATVRGIQAQGAMTMTQQFIANVQGKHRGGGLDAAEGWNFVVDDRTLHEMYLAPFEAAVRAGTSSIMMAYNKINGDYNSENQHDLQVILRDQLGWQGWADSDWHANRHVYSMARGLDVEMPGFGPMDPEGFPPQYGPKLKSAISDGTVSEKDLDRAVGNLLRQMELFGLLDNTRKPAPAEIDVEADAKVARRVAVEGAVLLKNNGVLPLSQQSLKSLAIIGPTAGQLAAGAGGNRAYGFSERLISPLDALKKEEPAANIRYAVGDPLTGIAIPAQYLSPLAGNGLGLARDNNDGTPLIVEPVDYVNRTLPAARSFTWRGKLTVPASGAYTLEIASWGGSAQLKVDGRVRGTSAKLAFGHGVPRRWTSLLPSTDGLDHSLATMQLEAGKPVTIEVEGISEATTPMKIRLGWITPEMRSKALDEAIAAAKASDTAVVFLWNGRGGDQNQDELGDALPSGQDSLVNAVVAANPKTIVVMNTSTVVSMPWKDTVQAILQMWNPGQEGGWATADLLTGRANPSGRLPTTVPLKIGDTAVLASGHPERYDGIAEKQEVVFSEGIFFGYRWFESQNIAPLYPFGYGLSYTSFGYSDLKAAPAADGGANVTFTVKNNGRVAGDEVAQVYVQGAASSPVPMAPESLSGFTRASLAPGESKTLTVHVPLRQFCYWSTEKQDWVIAGGARDIFVGGSSRSLPLHGSVQIARNGEPSGEPRAGELGAAAQQTGRIRTIAAAP